MTSAPTVAPTEFLSCPNCIQTFLAQGSSSDQLVQCAHCAHQDPRHAFPAMETPDWCRDDRRPSTQLPMPRQTFLPSEVLRPGLPLNAAPTLATPPNQQTPPPQPEAVTAEAAVSAPSPGRPITAEHGVFPEAIPEIVEFSCPACTARLAITTENAGEAIDCNTCGVAVVSPDPDQHLPAILFRDLLARMGIAPASEPVPVPEDAPRRQIAEFKLSAVDESIPDLTSQEEVDPMAWLEPVPSQPAKSKREPLWSTSEHESTPADIATAAAPASDDEPGLTESEPRQSHSKGPRFRSSFDLAPSTEGRQRENPRIAPLRIAAPSRQDSRASPSPKPLFTVTEVTAAAAAFIAIGAVSYALFSFRTDKNIDDPVTQPKTVIVTQPSPESPTGEATEPIANRPATPYTDGLMIDESRSEEQQRDLANQEILSVDEPPPRQVSNEKILNFEKSRDALRAFCEAKTAEERLQFVLKPDLYEEEVQSYHQQHGPTCIQLRELIHGQTTLSKDGERYWSSFLVQTNKNPRGFTVTMQETESGPRLSWPAFVQHHDSLFEEYLDEQPENPQIFCANISRGYSVDPNAPDPKKFHCFRIRGSESPRGKAKAYVDRKSYLGEQLERNVDWDSEVPITVELQWQKDDSKADTPTALFIREVLEYHW